MSPLLLPGASSSSSSSSLSSPGPASFSASSGSFSTAAALSFIRNADVLSSGGGAAEGALRSALGRLEPPALRSLLQRCSKDPYLALSASESDLLWRLRGTLLAFSFALPLLVQAAPWEHSSAG